MDILNLSRFTVLSISENEHDFLIQMETNSPPSHCPHCGCVANLYKHSNREQLCMDLPIHGKRVGLLIKRQRYKCRECNQTFWERLDHTIDEKRSCTKRLLSYVEKQSLKRTFVSISDDVGMDEKTVRNIFRDYINRLEETLRFETPNWLGIDEIHVLDCGIVDYKKVSLTYQRLIEEFDNEFRFSTKVEKVYENSDEVTLETNRGTIKARYLINCAGLYSDKLAKMAGLETGMKIVPFRGEYYELVKEKEHLVKNLIYPVPNPNFPFLGVHLTRMITGGIHAGPNAVLAFRREGYKKTDVHMKELFEVLGYPGFWKMALPNVKEGMHELIRSLFKKAFLKSLQRLVPEIQMNDIVPSSSGVRAQALTRDGRLVDDFAIFEGKRSIHVCNAPSPAATASLKIGQEIVRRFRASFLQ